MMSKEQKAEFRGGNLEISIPRLNESCSFFLRAFLIENGYVVEVGSEVGRGEEQDSQGSFEERFHVQMCSTGKPAREFRSS